MIRLTPFAAALTAGLFSLHGVPVRAADINVDGVNCTLPEAIANANTDSDSGANGCAAGSGPDTLLLAGTHAVNVPLAVNSGSVITIKGSRSAIIQTSGTPYGVNVRGDLSVFDTIVAGNGTVSTGITVGSPNGALSLNNSEVSGFGGDGILNRRSTRLLDSKVSGNAGVGITSDSFVYVGPGSEVSNNGGRGISASGGGTVLMTGATVSGNSAGGLRAGFGGTFTVSNSIISGNSAGSSYGGGIVLEAGQVNLSNSTVSGNSASAGGGIASGTDSRVSIDKSTLSGNAAEKGGALFNHYGTVSLSDSTLSGNSASSGGGIHTTRGSISIANSTITGNTASAGAGAFSYRNLIPSYNPRTTVGGSIVSGNNGPDVDVGGASVTTQVLFSNGYNLIGDGNAISAFAATGDVFFTNPLLEALADNGGPTRTHALKAASPARNANAGFCPGTDQRGAPRPFNAVCDIGAFEFGATVPGGTPPPPVSVASLLAAPTLGSRSTNPTPVAEGAAGVFSFTAGFCNSSTQTIANGFTRTRVLSTGKSLISRTRNAPSGAPGGPGSEQDFPDTSLAPSECVNVNYRIGLNVRSAFEFRVDVLGNVVP